MTSSSRPDEINGAMQGDQVLVELAPPRADGRRLGRIARILERRNPTVVGDLPLPPLRREIAGNYVIPFDERMTQPIFIPDGQEFPAAPDAATPHRVLGSEATARPEPETPDDLEGLVVDVEITSWPTPTTPAHRPRHRNPRRSRRLRRRRRDDDPQASASPRLS